MPKMSTRVLLQYLCGLELIIKQEDKFFSSELSNEFLAKDEFTRGLSSFANESLISFKNRLYNPKIQPWYTIKNNSNSLKNVDGISSEFFTSNIQHNWRIEKGKELAENHNLGSYNHLLDIGGASGGWCIGIRKIYPHLKCTVFDLPEVSKFSEQRISKSNAKNMINSMSGDMFKNSNYPSNIDVILLANVLHDWSPEDIIKILKNIYKSYSKITLLISELFLNDNWNGPLTNTIQSILVLGPSCQSGWQPSYIEMEQLLQQVGFQGIIRKENLLICKKNIK